MRLDKYLFENDYYSSRNKALEAITRGEVFVNGKVIKKPSFDVTENEDITISSENKPYVSLGGYKLDCAIKKFLPEIAGKTFIDVGASTGGFTDCLLRNGAKKVYCVDVGEGLLDKTIAADPKVVVMDNTNARFLTEKDFDEKMLKVDTWFENGIPICAEVCYNNQRILNLTISDFTMK